MVKFPIHNYDKDFDYMKHFQSQIDGWRMFGVIGMFALGGSLLIPLILFAVFR